MKLLVLGLSGMLGHKTAQVLGRDLEVWGTVRTPHPELADITGIPESRLLTDVDDVRVPDAIERVAPDVVINCIGVVKQLDVAKNAVATITGNSLLPHRAASACDAAGAKLIQISTDCVFLGRKGCYREEDTPDAEDLYGRSKLLGEVTTAPHLTLRTSIIGRELGSSHGLVEWFMGQPGPSVPGFTRAVFSGLPTICLAGILGDLIRDHLDLTGLHHVSAGPISKCDLLRLVRDSMRPEIQIAAVEGPIVDRSLDSRRFRKATGFTTPAWPAMVEAMATDAAQYESWRRLFQ